jgi:hypothetical protein
MSTDKSCKAIRRSGNSASVPVASQASSAHRRPQRRPSLDVGPLPHSAGGWGTTPNYRLSGYLWLIGMFGLLTELEANRIGLFLMPPFGAALAILMLAPDAAIARPYALIAGSVMGAAVGTGVSLIGGASEWQCSP